ncbi:MAG TPA: cytochrome P450 [Mycobacteriales bacterium]
MTSPAHVAGRLADLRDLTPVGQINAHADLQAVYRMLRAQWGEVAPVELEPGINGWLVMGYEEMMHVLRHERLFAKNSSHWRDLGEGMVNPDSPLLPMMAARPNAYFSDGDEHRRLRAPLDEAVARLKIRHTREQTTEVCESLISGFAPRGQADLLSEYAMMIPTLTVGRMLGLGLDQAHEMHRAMMDLSTNGADAQTGNDRFTEIMMDLVHLRQAEPAEDMTTVIVQHPNMENDFERAQSMALMIAGAAECTMAWIGSALQLLLTDLRFAGRMLGGRLGIDDALDEVLWREPPLSNLPARYALRDTELAGQPIEQGDPLILAFGAANADPRVHSDDPWSELGNRAHLAWSGGPHICPAHVPARVIVRTSVETALYQLPGLRLAVSADEIVRLPSPWTRCPGTLPVIFAPRTA